MRFNGEWLRMESEELFGLMRRFTVARLLERDDFTKRMAAAEPISALELLYPVLQGYDSVAIDADVELGGTDQKFNLLFGRDVQDSFGKPAQSVLTMPILPGTDGVRRMSKSLGNYVGVTDPPDEMFGKLMSVPDEVMDQYYLLLLDEELDPRATGRRGQAGARRGVWWTASTATAPGPRPRRTSTRSTSAGRCPDDIPEATLAAGRRRVGPPAGADRRRVRGLERGGQAPAGPGRRPRSTARRSTPLPSTCRLDELTGPRPAGRQAPICAPGRLPSYTGWSPSRRIERGEEPPLRRSSRSLKTEQRVGHGRQRSWPYDRSDPPPAPFRGRRWAIEPRHVARHSVYLAGKTSQA